MDESRIERIEEDVKEIKKDVKALMMFMAINKAMEQKKNKYTSAIISIVVSLVTFGVTKYFGG